MSILIIIFLVLASLFLLVFSIAFLYRLFFLLIIPMASGAPFASTDSQTIKTMVFLAGNLKGKTAVDIGSGDGRLVIALAQEGAQAHGYEINPFLVMRSKRNIKKAGLTGQAFIHWKSFWKQDFSQYDIVTVYGISYIMKRLEKKLKSQLKPGSKVVSNYFTSSTWPHEHKLDDIYVYFQR